MKFSVSSYSFSKYITDTKCDYFKICDLAKEMGFDAIEFTPLENESYGITTDPMKTAKELRAYCEKIGLDISAYTVGADIRAEKEEAVKKVKAYIDVAEALGAKVVRFDVCYGLPKDKHPYSYRDAIKEMVPYIRELADYGEAKGIRTCTENHGYVFQSPEVVEELILAVDHKNYGWLCDVGNFLCTDADPITAVAIALPYAFHIHFKDFLMKPGNQPCPKGFFTTRGGNHIRGTIIGHGVVPTSNCITMIKKSGYNGYVSVEFEGMERCLDAISAGLDFLKKGFAE